MKLNNFMFKEEFAYTYAEVCGIVKQPYSSVEILHPELFRNKTHIAQFLSEIGTITITTQTTPSIVSNDTGWSFILSNGVLANAIPARVLQILSKVGLRYKEHYALVSDTSNEEKVRDASLEFMTKVFNVLDYTFNKYDAILSAYESQKTHMLDKLSRIRSEEKEHSVEGEHSNTRGTEVDTTSSSASKTAGSDTPQTINVQASFDELKGYFNKYDQGEDEGASHSEGTDTDSGTNSSSGTENLDATETYDPMTIMARIDEIQTQYENTMFKWVEEFDRLFIEEGNI